MEFLKNLLGKKVDYPGWQIIDSNKVTAKDTFIDDLYNDVRPGFLIKNVLSKSEVVELRDALDTFDEQIKIKLGFGRTIGKSLMGSETSLEDYLAKAKLLKSSLAKLSFSFEDRVLGVFQKVSGGRKAMIPTKGDDEYCLTNIRDLAPTQGGLHAHIGNEFVLQYDALKGIAEMADLYNQLSYFVVLQKPEQGGGLIMYNMLWTETPKELLDGTLKYYSDERNEYMDKYYSFTIQPEEGDMILFSGGKIWHRVDNIGGNRSRITAGGFAAKSRDESKVYVWS
jgi:hypothetical protein